MKRKNQWRTSLWATIVILVASVPAALAGPPLICHSFSIGDAKSLPWDPGDGNWYSPSTNYDIRRLADDTNALLGDNTPVIVRMETIRRAALYSARDASINRVLLESFRARAFDKTPRHALRLFDYGYLIATLKQASIMREAQNVAANVSGLDGYPIIQEALKLRGNDPEMEFAAAVVTVWPKHEQHKKHFSNAVSGAAGDPLLAANLLQRFSERGKTLADLRAGADMLAKK